MYPKLSLLKASIWATPNIIWHKLFFKFVTKLIIGDNEVYIINIKKVHKVDPYTRFVITSIVLTIDYVFITYKDIPLIIFRGCDILLEPPQSLYMVVGFILIESPMGSNLDYIEAT